MTDDQIWSLCMAICFSGFIVGLALILAIGHLSRAIRGPHTHYHYGKGEGH